MSGNVQNDNAAQDGANVTQENGNAANVAQESDNAANVAQEHDNAANVTQAPDSGESVTQWLTAHIDTVHAGLDAVTAMLSALGIDSVSVEDETEFHEFLEQNRAAWDYVEESLEESMRGRSRVTFYLPDNTDGYAALANARIALQALKDSRDDCGPLIMSVERTQNSDWEYGWKDYYKPLEVGNRLLIVPKWEAADIRGRVPVVLDPGLSFGTGEHPTTQLCLTLLEKRVRGGERVLDLGCGSGILSIAALNLGAATATAVDIDEMCQRVAVENAALNQIGPDRFTVLCGDILSDADLLRRLGGGYDIILANIVADVIIALAPVVPNLLAPDGHFLCSGIIAGRETEVADALRRNGFAIADAYSAKDWYAYHCTPETLP
ncbi:MAG: 50S ribosomal protein L11 methyltransferase [Oscillibacter sp.]|nr:50S ribosomal protein L11 methyltransferase [Oscillibacter sp.]